MRTKFRLDIPQLFAMKLFFILSNQLLFILVFTVPGVVCAQTERENWIVTSISGISPDEKIEDLKVSSNGEYKDLDLYPATRSRLLKYTGPRQISFYRENKALSEDGEVTRKLVGQVKLDGEHSRYLLVFNRNPGETESYSIIAIPDSNEEFEAGTYRFLNLASFKIAVRIGESLHMLPAGSITDVTGDFDHGNYYQTLMLSIVDDSADPVPAYSGRVYFNQHMRMLYIIRPKIGGKVGRIEFTGIPDRVR